MEHASACAAQRILQGVDFYGFFSPFGDRQGLPPIGLGGLPRLGGGFAPIAPSRPLLVIASH
jgi:hypothetical protein